MIHHVPDPVELEEPVVPDLFFVGCEYRHIADVNIIEFVMRSDEVSVSFKYDPAGFLASRPYTHFGYSDEVWDLLVQRHGRSKSWSFHRTDLDITVDAGPEIMEHMDHWLGNSLNIEIDLSELRKSAST